MFAGVLWRWKVWIGAMLLTLGIMQTTADLSKKSTHTPKDVSKQWRSARNLMKTANTFPAKKILRDLLWKKNLLRQKPCSITCNSPPQQHAGGIDASKSASVCLSNSRKKISRFPIPLLGKTRLREDKWFLGKTFDNLLAEDGTYAGYKEIRTLDSPLEDSFPKFLTFKKSLEKAIKEAFLPQKHIDDLYDILESANKIFRCKNIPYSISCGSLLGYIRNGGPTGLG